MMEKRSSIERMHTRGSSPLVTKCCPIDLPLLEVGLSTLVIQWLVFFRLLAVAHGASDRQIAEKTRTTQGAYEICNPLKAIE